MTPRVAEDPLAPARGILYGLAGSLLLWAGIWKILRILEVL